MLQYSSQSRRAHGFTLIEILIAVAIVSILAMVGTPFYQAYTVKAKVGADTVLMEPLKRLLTEHYILTDNWPKSNSEAGGKPPIIYSGIYLNSVTVTDSPKPGSMILEYDNTILRILGNKNTLIYYPTEDSRGGVSTWSCDAGTMDNRFRPAFCRTEE